MHILSFMAVQFLDSRTDIEAPERSEKWAILSFIAEAICIDIRGW